MKTMRVLIRPGELLDVVREILDRAVAEGTGWDCVAGKYGVVDHYGYSNTMLSSVVLMKEPNSMWYRLTLRTGENDTYDELIRVVLDYYRV